MQVHPVLALDIMFGTWIWEIIHLHPALDALPYETETVLPYNHRIDGSLTYQQLAFEVPGLVYQTCL